MRKVRKAHGDKVILDDVTLNFLPGAKIGVVGPNGAGKSSVLKIMAGLDQPSNGDAFLTPGLHGRHPACRSRQLDEDKTSAGTSRRASARSRSSSTGTTRSPSRWPPSYTDELMEEMGQLQEELDAADAWDLDSQLEQAMDALRCPPPDADVNDLSGGERRRVALCKLLLQQARPAAARRADQPPRRRERAVARAAPGSYAGAVLAVTHDRYFLDNVAAVDPRARPRPRLPVRGQLLDLPGEEAGAAEGPGRQGRQAGQAPQGRARVGPLERQGPPDQEQGPACPLRGDGGRGRPHPQARLRRDPDPAGSAPGHRGDRGEGPRQGLRRPAADREPLVLAAPQRHRRRHRPERRRQDHAVQDDRRAGEAATPAT